MKCGESVIQPALGNRTTLVNSALEGLLIFGEERLQMKRPGRGTVPVIISAGLAGKQRVKLEMPEQQIGVVWQLPGTDHRLQAEQCCC